MKKLFHEVAMQPESILREDAITLLRELRLDHFRYVQDLPDDWFNQVQSILKITNSKDNFKKMALLEKLKSSIIKTRSNNHQSTINENKKWRELVSSMGRDNPFDLQIERKELFANGNVIDLDDYLELSESELGSLNMPFKTSNDWYKIIQPIIMSDNSIAIVDRYFDLGSQYYSKLFIEFIQWLRRSKVSHLRIFIGPKSADEIRSNFWKNDFQLFCDQAVSFLNLHAPDLRSSIIVSSCQELHLRYFGSKVCAIELDYGFRLSGSKIYKVTAMRASALNDFKSQFFSRISGPNYLTSKSIWPLRK